MSVRSGSFLALLICSFAASLNGHLLAQATPSCPTAPCPALIATAADLPNAPTPQWLREPATQNAPTPTPTPDTDPQQVNAADPQTPTLQSGSTPNQHEKAEQQLSEQKQQRVLGVVPTFNVSYRSDNVSLTAIQKIRLAISTVTDPVTFATAFVIAGYHEAADDYPGFRWGPEGYGRRVGAAYLDTLDGTMIGNGFLPALLHQDPRYFRRGHGTITRRALYALSTNVVCHHDTGRLEPNYSNILGNIASGALSNLYYPSSDSGIGLTISNGLLQTAIGGIGSVFEEFWPDISRKVLHKDPTHGLDAQARAQDANR